MPRLVEAACIKERSEVLDMTDCGYISVVRRSHSINSARVTSHGCAWYRHAAFNALRIPSAGHLAVLLPSDPLVLAITTIMSEVRARTGSHGKH